MPLEIRKVSFRKVTRIHFESRNFLNKLKSSDHPLNTGTHQREGVPNYVARTNFFQHVN